jgi:ligand-binding sensor domain-containing protein/two-component sensor histidine kinase
MKSKLSKYFVLIAGYSILSVTVVAQSDSLIFHLVNNPALQQFAIRKVCSSKDGKLWLSTDKGVVSFNGNDVRIFDHKDGDTTTLRMSSISKSFPDNRGNLFVVMVATGIDYLDTKTGKATHVNIQIDSKDSSRLAFPSAYSDIYVDNDGTIWAGLYNLGFVHYDLKTKKTTVYKLHADLNAGRNSVYAIQPDVKNQAILWLATDDGIYSFNKQTQKLNRKFISGSRVDSSEQDLQVLRMVVNNKDSIWFAIPGKGMGCYHIADGVYRIFSQRKTPASKEIIDLTIIYLQNKNHDELYIGCFDSIPGTFNIITHQYSFASKTFPHLESHNVSQVFADNFGNFWFVDWDQLYVAPTHRIKFGTILIKDKYYPDRNANTFKNIVWEPKQRLYYAAFDNSDGIFVFDSTLKITNRITEEVLHPAFPETRALDAGLDRNRQLWLSNLNLTVYDSSTKKMVLTEKVFPKLKFNDERFQNFVFRGKYIFLQPSNLPFHALYRINIETHTFDSISYPPQIVDRNEYDDKGKTLDEVEVDKTCKYAYLAFHNNLFQFDLTKRVLKKVVGLTNEQKPWQHFFNNSWYKLDDSNHLWVATNRTIFIYEPENLRLIRTIDQEKDSYIMQLYNVENYGLMCVLYSGGVIIYDYINHKQFRLTHADGLISITLNSSIACVNGMLFVGSFNYLQYIPLDNAIRKNVVKSTYLWDVRIFNKPYHADTLPEYLHSLTLPHSKNFIEFNFSSTEFEFPEGMEYRYKLTGVNDDWIYTNYLGRTISYNDLEPGKYKFFISIKNKDGTWSDNTHPLELIIQPAWWQTNLFKILSLAVLIVFTWFFIRWRIKTVRKQEQRRSIHEKELLELEAKALRAQMNPHFIFNCLNSIKSLIQQHEEKKSIIYLTTFSKLIRTLFQNSDKRQISLYDEIETCKLYAQLEAMRLNGKLEYNFDIDPNLDLKSVMVPALIIQPFIENAIWHGIVPKDKGRINVSVKEVDESIVCEIDDDGIGREMSTLNKPITQVIHESKGVRLSQTRLDIERMLNETQANINIIDKYENTGSTGTKVVITFNLN